MKEYGFDVVVNPFGTVYNPVSIANSLSRIVEGPDFGLDDVVSIGAGDGRYCSFNHHTKLARTTAEEFLEEANHQLASLREYWGRTELVVVTLGTAWCFRRVATGETVSNCLKHVSSEFERYRLTVSESVASVGRIVELAGGRKCIFSVSPIRHMADGAHGNRLSKATLHLAVEEIVGSRPDMAEYFPAYEIVMDELRDYRFYAEDMVHPSQQTRDYIFERFMDFGLPTAERGLLEQGRQRVRRSRHIAAE